MKPCERDMRTVVPTEAVNDERRAYSLLETTMEGLCPMVEYLEFQQVLTGKPNSTRTLLLLDTEIQLSEGRDNDSTGRH